jgi:hypothetical protein
MFRAWSTFMLCNVVIRPVIILGCVLLWCTLAAAQVERTSALGAAGASDAVKQAVEDKGYSVQVGDWHADFWFAKQVKTAEKDTPGALYPELSNGEFVGVVNLPRGMTDFRGQAIPTGLYTLRYQLLPQDGNHMGVSPNPDFLLAIPAASDPDPAQHYLYKKLTTLSAKTAGTGHPAVIALDSAGEPGPIIKDAHGLAVFSVAIASTGLQGTVKLGIVVRGAAAQ